MTRAERIAAIREREERATDSSMFTLLNRGDVEFHYHARNDIAYLLRLLERYETALRTLKANSVHMLGYEADIVAEALKEDE